MDQARKGIRMHRRRSVTICLPHLLHWQERQWQEKGHYRLQKSKYLDWQRSQSYASDPSSNGVITRQDALFKIQHTTWL